MGTLPRLSWCFSGNEARTEREVNPVRHQLAPARRSTPGRRAVPLDVPCRRGGIDAGEAIGREAARCGERRQDQAGITRCR
jgi:hypothetical protein